MIRRASLVVAVGAGLLGILPAVPATAGGGGCHGGVTQGNGDTVEMVDACFTPTIVRIDRGGSVTWINRDDFTHNVTANAWGHFDDMNRGDAFRASFEEPGVYPFACTYHPGMTGAVVVGDGTGAGSGSAVVVESVSLGEPKRPPTAAAAPIGGTSPAGWWIGGAIGLLVGAGLGLALRRTGTRFSRSAS